MTIPTPQEVQQLVERMQQWLADFNSYRPSDTAEPIIREAAAALSAYQQEVERLTQPVINSEWEQLTARAEAAEARVRELEQERDENETWGRQAEDRADHNWRLYQQARQSAFAEAAQMVRDEMGAWFGDGRAALDWAADGLQIVADKLAKATPPIPTEERE
jgi:hypothetical protein